MKRGRVDYRAINYHSESCLQKNSSEGIGGLPILVQVDGNLVDNELLGIGGPPIRWIGKRRAVRSSICRAAKKPTKAKWLLGNEYEMEIDIEYKGVQPRAAWRMSDKIQRWGITWRDSTPTNPDVSLGINGDLGSAIMMSHGMTLLALSEVMDELFPFALVALLAVHPIRPGDGDDDFTAVVLDATMCHMELYAGAQERGLQFPDGYAEDGDDILIVFSIVEAARDQVIKERAEAAAKPTNRPRLKKSNVATAVQVAGDKIAVTRESSWPKRKSGSASGGQGSRGKKLEGKLMLAAAIVQANNLTAKTKPADVEAMYKSLEDGLEQCFPYGKTPSRPKFPRIESTSPPLSSTASSWRREKSKFSWSGRCLE